MDVAAGWNIINVMRSEWQKQVNLYQYINNNLNDENFIWTDLIFTWMFINQYVIIEWELNTAPNMKLSNWIYKFYTFAQKLQTITVRVLPSIAL